MHTTRSFHSLDSRVSEWRAQFTWLFTETDLSPSLDSLFMNNCTHSFIRTVNYFIRTVKFSRRMGPRKEVPSVLELTNVKDMQKVFWYFWYVFFSMFMQCFPPLLGQIDCVCNCNSYWYPLAAVVYSLYGLVPPRRGSVFMCVFSGSNKDSSSGRYG